MSERRIVWEGEFLRVVVDDGWEFVERKGISGIVGIVPITEEDEVVLIEQLRVPAGARCIELPAGLAGDEPGTEDEPFETAARRELLEETGYEAGRLEHLYEGVVSAGLTNESMTWFLATGCRKVGPGGGDDAEEIDVHVVPLADVLQWIEEQQNAGKTFDVKALSILDSWLKPRLEVP